MEGLMHQKYIRSQIGEAARVMAAMMDDQALTAAVQAAALACISCLQGGGKLRIAFAIMHDCDTLIREINCIEGGN